MFKYDDVRTPSKQNDIFSCVTSRKPPSQLLNRCDKVLLLTPDGTWDPNIDICSRNEQNKLDYKGEMADQNEQGRALMS